MTFPLIPVLLNALHNAIPPALSPMVYALKNKELRKSCFLAGLTVKDREKIYKPTGKFLAHLTTL